MFDVGRLWTLREVARRGSFAAAAEARVFTASAVSQQMTALEREAGTPLFERQGRGVRLTDAGLSLAEHADKVLAILADARIELDLIRVGEGGRLRLGSFPSATAAFVAEAISTFRERFPRVQLSYVSGEPFELLPLLRERELDLAIVFTFDRWPAGRDYEGRTVCRDDVARYESLFDDPYCLITPEGHRFADMDRIPVSQLAGERIMGNPRSGSPWAPDFIAACELAGFHPEFEDSYYDWDFQSMQAFVATGRGITLLPKLGLGVMRPGVLMKTLDDGPRRRISAAMPSAGYIPPAAGSMISVLRETACRVGYC